MTKQSLTSTGKPIVRQLVKFGRGDEREVRFIAHPKRVTVTGKDLPKITIKHVRGEFVGVAKIGRNRNKVVTQHGTTPEQAFKRMVKAAWH